MSATVIESDYTCSSVALSLREIASWHDVPQITDRPVVRASVPVLQRGLVWNPAQIELLWDSILRGFPIGALVLSAKVENQTKEADRNRDGITHHLLDGQQRCDAIALGFKDPFADTGTSNHTGKSVPSILWLDIDPSPDEWSTREFVVRLTTPAHPWGYTRRDEAKPLGAFKIREALQRVGQDPASADYRRPSPDELCPQEANVPVPLSWLLLNAQQGELWTTIESQLNSALRRPWHDALLGFLKSPEKAQHRVRVERALSRIQQTRVIALCAPNDLLDSSKQETHSTTERADISSIEHLFQRLNQQGTRLDGEELAYSMIKAYWPELAGPIDQMQKPMPASRLIALGIRAALSDSSPSRMPDALGVSQIRKLAGNGDGTTNLVRAYIGRDLERGCLQIRDWLLYHPERNRSGLLPVHIASIAHDSPELFLVLLTFAKRQAADWIIPDSARARVLQAMVTIVHWFGREKSTVARRISTACAEVISEENIKRGLAEAYAEGHLRPIHSPSAVQEFFETLPAGVDLSWNWGDMCHQNQPEEVRKKLWDTWGEFFWFRSQRELLLYAQRDFVSRRFQDYDPTRQDYWMGHNRPWDFDHILAGAYVRNKQGDFKRPCAEWLDNIGNFRAWPMEDNRSDQAETAFEKLSGPENEQKRRDSFIQENELQVFSHGHDTRKRREFASEFVAGCRARMLRIYREWYGSVAVDRLFTVPLAGAPVDLPDAVQATSPQSVE